MRERNMWQMRWRLGFSAGSRDSRAMVCADVHDDSRCGPLVSTLAAGDVRQGNAHGHCTRVGLSIGCSPPQEAPQAAQAMWFDAKICTRVVATRCSQELCSSHVASPLALNSGVVTTFHKIQSAAAEPGAGPRHQYDVNVVMLPQVSSGCTHAQHAPEQLCTGALV